MTKQPFNINTVLEEFKEFYQINGLRINGGKWIGKDSVEKFLISSIRRSMEAVKPERIDGNNGEGLPFENSPEIYGNQRVEAYKNGHNSSIDQLEQNQTNFFNETKV